MIQFKQFLVKNIFIACFFCLVFSISPTYAVPITGAALEWPEKNIEYNYPANFETFKKSVYNGRTSQVTGIFVAGVFAHPVVQQPMNQAAYVDPTDNTVTQFSSASYYGSYGFLAHNYKAGKSFSNLERSDHIVIVFGDGKYEVFQVDEIKEYQVLTPNSPYSDFIDLDSGQKLSAEALFYETYGIQGNLILQTCIEKDGVDSWGRLFIIARPVDDAEKASALVAMSNPVHHYENISLPNVNLFHFQDI